MLSSIGSLVRGGIRDTVGAPCEVTLSIDPEHAHAKTSQAALANLKLQGFEHCFDHIFTEKSLLKGHVTVKSRKTLEFDRADVTLTGEVTVASGLVPVGYTFLSKSIPLECRPAAEPSPSTAAPTQHRGSAGEAPAGGIAEGAAAEEAGEGRGGAAPAPSSSGGAPQPTKAPRLSVGGAAGDKVYSFDFGNLHDVEREGEILRRKTALAKARQVAAAAAAAAAAEAEAASGVDGAAAAAAPPPPAGSSAPVTPVEDVIDPASLPDPVVFETYAGGRVYIKYYIEFVMRREGLLSVDVHHKKGLFFRLETSNLNRTQCPSLFAMKGIARHSDTLWDRPYHVYERHASPARDQQQQQGAPADSESGGAADPLEGTWPAPQANGGEGAEGAAVGQSVGQTQQVPAGFRGPPGMAMPVVCTAYSDVREQPLRMCLALDQGVAAHILIERNVYHCKDIVKGRFYFDGPKSVYNDSFEMVDCHIQLFRKEVFVQGDGSLTLLTQDSLFRSEIVDGAPTLRQVVPLSLPLRGIASLGPSHFRVAGRASVNYFLRLTASFKTTPEARVPTTCFTESELILWRLPIVKQ